MRMTQSCTRHSGGSDNHYGLMMMLMLCLLFILIAITHLVLQPQAVDKRLHLRFLSCCSSFSRISGSLCVFFARLETFQLKPQHTVT